jgi:hypothetical protein
VTDPAELTHAVLLKVAEFLRRLPTEQLNDLAEGSAKLELVPKGGRPAPRPRTAAQPAVPADRVRADLEAIGDRAAARQYLLDLGLTVAQYKTLAKELNIIVSASAKKDVVIQALVQWTVGRRSDSDTISQPAPAHL